MMACSNVGWLRGLQRSIGITALLLAALGQAQAQAPAPTQTPPSVHVKQGTLAGIAAGDIVHFKGIPYAAPPTGPLRWRAPRPALSFKGVRDASKFGNGCVQFGGPSMLPPGIEPSEDCLTLNVSVPADRSTKPLPVMVWLHGGGFTRGSSASPFASGDRFVKRGIVFVSVNYRLGPLGFFAHRALTREDPNGPLANYGLMDQIAALRWVQQNIARFGGDPHKVTLVGESAGGISVDYLMVAPSARGLFQRAISQSSFGRHAGPALARATKPGAAAAEVRGEAFGKAEGIAPDDPAAPGKLRALSVERLQQRVLENHEGLSDVVIDGKVLTTPVVEAFAAGTAANVPFMIGGTSWESVIFDFARKDPQSVLRRGGDPDRLFALFDPSGKRDAVLAAQNYLTDSEVTEPARYLAKLHAARKRPAFVYHFSYVPLAQRGKVPGAGHAAEIGYVFGTLPDRPLQTMMGQLAAATPADRALSDAMNAYWAAFVTAADPGSVGGVRWPAFEAREATVMEFGVGGPAPRPQFARERLDFLESLAAHREDGAAAPAAGP